MTERGGRVAVRAFAHIDCLFAALSCGRSPRAPGADRRRHSGNQPRRLERRRFGTADESQLTVHDVSGHEEAIARSNVAEIETFAIRGSKAAAVGGAASGALVGGLFALHLAFSVRCQPSCGGVGAMMALSAIGIPIAAGFAGYYAF